MALVFAAAIAAALHGIADLWLWGHDGYNGAAFAQAARNSIRFEILAQAQYYTGLAPPGLAEIYTNHPLLLHLHLIGLFQLFGVHEWAARLVPATYSIGIVGVLFVVARRYLGRGQALLAITIWVLTPLHLIYGNMVDHEQGSLFWCLLFVYQYLRWLDEGRRRHLWGVLLSVSMAVQFDWPGYYLAFFVALHAFFSGLHRGRPAGRWWRREFSFVGWFSLTVLANFALFAGWIYHLRGGLGQMSRAYALRSSEPTHYLDVLASRSVDLYGVALLALLALWLLGAIARLVRGTALRVELIAWVFFFGQLVHSAVFQTAGIIHAYWTYHIGPTLALGGAITLWSAGAWFVAAARRRRPALRRALLAAGVLASVGLFVGQLDYAIAQERWGYDTGRAAYRWDYEDEYYDTLWARELGRRFPRDEVEYIIHESALRRIHFIFYLDAPRIERHHRLGFTPAEERGDDGKRHLLLVDLERLGIAEREQVAELARRFHALIWDRRFVAFDASRPHTRGLSYEAWIAESGEASWWWRWLHNFRRPPVTWVPDPSPEAVEALLATPQPGGPGELAGGPGGHPRRFDCPAGTVASELRVRYQPRGARLVAAVQLACRRGAPGGLPSPPEIQTLDGAESPWLGGDRPGMPSRSLRCGAGQLPVGLHGRAARLLDALGLLCARAEALRDGSGGPWRISLADATRSRSLGGKGGVDFKRVCPPGQVLTGVDIRSGALIDAIAIRCSPFDEAFIDELAGPLPRR